jgi:hypothetical protein
LFIPWKELRPVGIKMVNGSEKLAMIQDWQSDAVVWQFIEV